MADLIKSQLDYIFFFSGLAFIMLGAVGFTIRNRDKGGLPWVLLATFGIVHGAGEWLGLLALSVGDSPALSLAPLAIVAASFILLGEFARLSGIRFGMKIPGRWIYGLPALMIVIASAPVSAWQAGGPDGVNAVVRYGLALPGAMGAGWVFARLSRTLSGRERRWAISLGAAFGLFGIAAGAIVPAAAFWPADVLNYESFSRATGMPIQLLRGLLGGWAAFSLWAFGQEKFLARISSPIQAFVLHTRSIRTFIPMVAVILILGWVLTEGLGRKAQQEIRTDMNEHLGLLVSQFHIATATADDVARSMAASPWLLPLLGGGGEQTREDADKVVDLSEAAAGGDGIAYLMDRSGTVLASSNRGQSNSLVGNNYRFRPYFQEAFKGAPTSYFALGVTTGERGYYASYPVRDKEGTIAGVAVIKKPLDPIESDLKRSRDTFLIDSHGVVFLSSNPELLFRTLWPLSPDVQQKLTRSRQFGILRYVPLLEQEITDGAWIVLEGHRYYAGRLSCGHDGWSFVKLRTPAPIHASRLLGITISLLFAVMTIGYFLRMEWLLNEKIMLEQQLELEERARKLDLQAATDPLTGVFNRLRFNQVLSGEMGRSERYNKPFSLVMFDIDHFKEVNDAHGHLAGDQVLIQLCRIVASHIRQADVLARWGGEEFMILVPDCDGEQAYQLAEKLRVLIAEFDFGEVGTVTCSFGIVQFQEGDSLETLTSRVDRALYQAKDAGRNRVSTSTPGQMAVKV